MASFEEFSPIVFSALPRVALAVVPEATRCCILRPLLIVISLASFVLCRHMRVEKPADHRKQQIGALHKRNVGGAGEHRELGLREAADILHHAAEQAEHLHGVLGSDGVGIPDDEQGGRR
jgi:hypothetical protein